MNRRPLLQSAIIAAFFTAIWNMVVPSAPIVASNDVDAVVEQEIAAVADPFAEITVQAESFLVFDLVSSELQTLAGRESALRWPLASIAKLMTAVVARENISEDEAVVITAAAVSEHGDDGFLVGERFLRDDLVDLMLVRSSNDAARALADHLGYDRFLELMNEKASMLEMTQTYFTNTNGLDISASISGAYSSAQDLAKLTAHILKDDSRIFAPTEDTEFFVRSLSGKAHGYPNTNKLANRLPQLIGGKTGFTDIAGGNLLVVVDIGINHPVGIIVLGSTESGRFDDVMVLYEATLKYFRIKTKN